MPTKQIYLRNEDMALFAEAEQYGDSMSKVIVEAVRDFVERKRAERDEEGFAEVEIEVGKLEPEPKDIKVVKFSGMFITKLSIKSDFMEFEEKLDEATEWVVYKTKKGKFLVYRKHTEVCEDMDGRHDEKNASYFILDEWPKNDEAEMLNEKVALPKWLISKVNQSEFGAKTEWLDI